MFDALKFRIAVKAALYIACFGFIIRLFFFSTLANLLASVLFLFLFWLIVLHISFFLAEKFFYPLYSAIFLAEEEDGKAMNFNKAGEHNNRLKGDEAASPNAMNSMLSEIEEGMSDTADFNTSSSNVHIEDDILPIESAEAHKEEKAKIAESWDNEMEMEAFSNTRKEKNLERLKKFDTKQMAQAVSLMMEKDEDMKERREAVQATIAEKKARVENKTKKEKSQEKQK